MIGILSLQRGPPPWLSRFAAITPMPSLAMIKPTYQADGSFLLKQPPNARFKSLTFANSRPGAQDHTSPAQIHPSIIMSEQA